MEEVSVCIPANFLPEGRRPPVPLPLSFDHTHLSLAPSALQQELTTNESSWKFQAFRAGLGLLRDTVARLEQAFLQNAVTHC